MGTTWNRPLLRKCAGRLLSGAACFLIVLWAITVWKAYGHYREGRAHQIAGQTLEASREYQSAVGFYAPLNPWSGAAAETLQGLVQETRPKDPVLAFELEDRLRRSIQGVRWMIQPYRGVLEGLEKIPGKPMRDPSLWLFLLSLAGIVGGFGGLWMTQRGVLIRSAVFGGGMVVWALALYFC